MGFHVFPRQVKLKGEQSGSSTSSGSGSHTSSGPTLTGSLVCKGDDQTEPITQTAAKSISTKPSTQSSAISARPAGPAIRMQAIKGLSKRRVDGSKSAAVSQNCPVSNQAENRVAVNHKYELKRSGSF